MSKQLTKGKKVGIAIIAIVLIIAVLLAVFFMITGIEIKADKYTDEQHLQRVTERAQKRYIERLYTLGGVEYPEYTDMQIYPLYNADDRLEFFLIEFEPYGFVYVKINQRSGNAIMHSLGVAGMYTRTEFFPCRRYVFDDDGDRIYETDSEGNIAMYDYSHFKLANIGDEKRYLLRNDIPNYGGYIPAVKRGDKFLNLVSMEEFDLNDLNSGKLLPTGGITFPPKSTMDL